LQLVTGAETDTFSRSPAPTQLTVVAVDSSNSTTKLASVSLPASTVDLGRLDQNAVASLQVTAVDAAGAEIIYGSSLPMQYGSLAGLSVPVFVQRTGEFARLPAPFSDARPAPILTSVQGQYLFVAGGGDPALAAKTQFYDFLSFAPLASPPTLPRPVRSAAFVGPIALIVDEQGGTYFDFSSNSSVSATAPSGGSFADVAGGTTVVSDKGVAYIVGGTRTSGDATASVLVLDPNDSGGSANVVGKLTWASLTAPRLGASATWVTGRGLVVTGGSSTAAGAELLAALPSTTGSALPFAPDPSEGTGVVPLPPSGQQVLLAGGLDAAGHDAGARTLDLACTSACAPMAWGADGGALPTPIGSAQAFALDATTAVVVGSEASSLTHVFRLTTTSTAELRTKVPHMGARAAISPLGTLVIAGGAGEVESFLP
jgi:hypothetical protein